VDGCDVDDTLACSGGATGFVCSAGDNPEAEDPTISCSTATMTCDDPCTCEALYCCFVGPGPGGPSTCVSDDTLTAACPPGPDSYGYQCVTGDDPSTLDSSLASCSSPTPDADGVHDDFCCTYD
jgi:hypothetical protein